MIRLKRPTSKKFLRDPTQSKRIDDAYCKALFKLIDRYQAVIQVKVKAAWPAVLGMREAEAVSPISQLWDQIRAAQTSTISPKDMDQVAAEFSKKGYLQGVEFATNTLEQMSISPNIGTGPADLMAMDILKERNLRVS